MTGEVLAPEVSEDELIATLEAAAEVARQDAVGTEYSEPGYGELQSIDEEIDIFSPAHGELDNGVPSVSPAGFAVLDLIEQESATNENGMYLEESSNKSILADFIRKTFPNLTDKQRKAFRKEVHLLEQQQLIIIVKKKSDITIVVNAGITGLGREYLKTNSELKRDIDKIKHQKLQEKLTPILLDIEFMNSVIEQEGMNLGPILSRELNSDIIKRRIEEMGDSTVEIDEYVKQSQRKLMQVINIYWGIFNTAPDENPQMKMREPEDDEPPKPLGKEEVLYLSRISVKSSTEGCRRGF